MTRLLGRVVLALTDAGPNTAIKASSIAPVELPCSPNSRPIFNKDVLSVNAVTSAMLYMFDTDTHTPNIPTTEVIVPPTAFCFLLVITAYTFT